MGSSAQPSTLTKWQKCLHILPPSSRPAEASQKFQWMVSPQSNSYQYLSLNATLTMHGSCKEGSWAIKRPASVRRLLRRAEDFGMASLRKTVHRTSVSGRLARLSIPSFNEWKEASTTPSYLYLLQAKTKSEIVSDGIWKSWRCFRRLDTTPLGPPSA